MSRFWHDGRAKLPAIGPGCRSVGVSRSVTGPLSGITLPDSDLDLDCLRAHATKVFDVASVEVLQILAAVGLFNMYVVLAIYRS